jgi:hypothetical protein
MTASFTKRLRLARASIICGILGAFGFVAHFVLYHRTSVSAFVDRPEFYYNRFVIQDSSGQSVREVSLSTGFWTYAPAAAGLMFLASAMGSYVLSRRCK